MTARRQFILECGKAAGAFLLMACNEEQLLAPCRGPKSDEAPRPRYGPELKPIYIADDFRGMQIGNPGTGTNPYLARTAREFDALMMGLSSQDNLAINLFGSFYTRGCYEWGDFSYLGWRGGKYWTFDGAGEITIDPNAIADSEIDDPHLHVICMREQLTDWATPETVDGSLAESVWQGLPIGQAVRNITLNGSHSALADRWQAKGKVLRTSGAILQGHNAAIEKVQFRNFGAMKLPGVYAESFPAMITGAMGALDRNQLAQLDPATHILDSDGEPSHITDCTFDGFDPASSNDQVSVFVIIGSAGEPGGWNTGNWKQISRANCYQERNVTKASGSNWVQGHTIYQALKGRIRHNIARGPNVGVYGDYYATKRLDISENDFDVVSHGVQILLSPTPTDQAKDFSHEDYTIGPNRIRSGLANVSLDTLGPTTSTRFIRNISVDQSLSLENVGATDVRREALCKAAA